MLPSLLALIPLTWLTVMACVVAVCQLSADDEPGEPGIGEGDAFTAPPVDGDGWSGADAWGWEQRTPDVWEAQMCYAVSAQAHRARPHCESRVRRLSTSLRFQSRHGRNRVGRAPARRRCRRAASVCEHARRAQ
ncbi:MAG TPA: hypothetical protein VED41_01580 [Solirubrobacteraceae bacterium]|nr:hypothetical protein [Solirubrobacteraceae bacterium]